MEACKGCKYDLNNYTPKNEEEFAMIINRCSHCIRVIYPPNITWETDLYEPVKGVYMRTVEDIRKQIIETFFNNPKLGENYIDWHTENSGECGVTIMFKNANEEFDIIIRRK